MGISDTAKQPKQCEYRPEWDMFHPSSISRDGWGLCANDNTPRERDLSQSDRNSCEWSSQTSGNDTRQVTCYGFDPQASRDVGVAFYKECSKTLANGSAPGYYCGVVKHIKKTVYPDIVHTLIARMTTKTGNTQDNLVVVEKYEKQE